jgi:hypothetical protein
VGLLVCVFFAVVPIMRWQGAQDWMETPCTVISSKVGSHRDSDGTTYSIDIEYSYSFLERSYIGRRYNFMDGSSSGSKGKHDVVNQYPAGSERICYVNPVHPDQAVLSREFSYSYFIGFFGLIFFAVGLFIVVQAIRGKNKASLSQGGRIQADETDRVYEEELDLKPGKGRIGKLIFFMFFALCWNGIVGAVFGGIFMAEEGNPSWFVSLFLIPFVLIGIALMGAVIYYVLALFNPRPKLTLRPGALPLGSTADLEWSVSGAVRRISAFRIDLEGELAATYRQGTNTHTEKKTFERITILEATETNDLRLGRVQFTVPEFSMHSFDAPNNKVIWKLVVHGDIKRWPDIKDEFVIQVLPLVQ